VVKAVIILSQVSHHLQPLFSHFERIKKKTKKQASSDHLFLHVIETEPDTIKSSGTNCSLFSLYKGRKLIFREQTLTILSVQPSFQILKSVYKNKLTYSHPPSTTQNEGNGTKS
jgi:hypothetical protein